MPSVALLQQAVICQAPKPVSGRGVLLACTGIVCLGNYALIVGWLTVPGFFTILWEAPSKPFWAAFFLGGAYGFGGMSFGKAINYIGYSLTYTLAIGISAVLGTIFPLMIFGGLGSFSQGREAELFWPGMILSMLGVIFCGWAGFKKEKDINSLSVGKAGFNMTVGLLLTIVAGGTFRGL